MNKKFLFGLLLLVVVLGTTSAVSAAPANHPGTNIGSYMIPPPTIAEVIGTTSPQCASCHPSVNTQPPGNFCGGCHTDPTLTRNHPATMEPTLVTSVATEAECTNCHVNTNAKLKDGSGLPVTCTSCHPDPYPAPPVSAQTFNISGFKLNSVTNLGVPGWTINLTNATSNVQATTDANGMYKFTGLANGSYTVTEIMQTGWTNVTPTSLGVLITGADIMNKNFTNTPPPVVVVPTFNISGFKLNSATSLGVPGWTINLTNATSNVQATTDANGMYKFTGLANGSYTVTEIMQTGWSNVTPTSLGVLITGADIMNKNFTNTPPPVVVSKFNISGFKVNDTNGNNVWETGEIGIDNWNIVLLDATTGAQIASTSTDANGFYQFMNLMPGVYNVTEEMKAGFAPSGAIFKLVTIENKDVTEVDFLNHITVVPPTITNSISGFKINDLNGNGRQDASEIGIPGWNIKLIGIGPDTFKVKKETTTDENGFYSFENLPAGRYIVMETPLKRGYVPTDTPVKVVNLKEGTNSMNNNFMNRPIRSLFNIPVSKGKQEK
jgi:hypothetical protein